MLRCCRPAVATLLPLLPAAAPTLLLLSQPTQVRFPCAPWFALLCRNRVIVVDSSNEIAGNRTTGCAAAVRALAAAAAGSNRTPWSRSYVRGGA